MSLSILPTMRMGLGGARGEGAYLAAQLADSPVARWRLNETSGTTAVDDVGGYDGIYYGTPVLGSSGPMLGSLSVGIRGGGSYVEAPQLPLLENWSVECWFRRVGPQPIKSCIVTDIYQSSGVLNYYLTFWNETSVRAGYHVGASHGSSSQYDLPDVTWTHLVGTFDGSDVKLFENGNLSASEHKTTPCQRGGGVRIGRRWDLPDYVVGDVSAVAIYPTALSPARIAEHYAAAGI